MSSVELADHASRVVARALPVALADIEWEIVARYDLTAADAVQNTDPDLKALSICLLKMRNGFLVIGKSAPASPVNFNARLGRQFAYEDAVRQLWPLMGYALRERLADGLE